MNEYLLRINAEFGEVQIMNLFISLPPAIKLLIKHLCGLSFIIIRLLIAGGTPIAD